MRTCCRWILACWLLAGWMHWLSAGEAEKFDLAVELGAAQAEQLAAFAAKIDAKEGSWEADIRAQALALGKKLAPACKSVTEAQKIKLPAASAEERAANKAALAAIADKEKAREQAEAKLDSKAPVDPPPPPDNLRAEFDQLRFEFAQETLALAEELSRNPFAPTAALRTQLLTRAGDFINPLRFRYQRALKDKIEAAKRAQYTPFQGSWKTDWGTLELKQNATQVTANGDVRLQGNFDAREGVVKGNYWKGQEAGSFEWHLSRDERSFDGTCRNPRAQPPADVPMKGARTDTEGSR